MTALNVAIGSHLTKHIRRFVMPLEGNESESAWKPRTGLEWQTKNFHSCVAILQGIYEVEFG